ncbi:GGDEF domain-containing protein [Colwellia sp. MB02u-10]|jgi:diguanylate cyclase (GGDEF)-like protein|uniref:GGDEF domain-containing protein n=1 Tax=Colwellia sp. MB02u-10 TaxID=2759828 RepID=UPI0015F407A5|nr:GGDEF domain-containing protein [Colwellia sp. MB02u-10]MBA6340095.1 GGDEF domain-containing protein [Colwellia sp. MB02u-10]
MKNRSAAEKMLLIFSAFAAITISPFIYLRWLDGDMVMASIDAALMLATAVFFVFVYYTRKVNTAKLTLAIFLSIAIVTIVAIRGQSHLFWLYPSMIAFFYMLSARSAGIICFVAIMLIAITLFPTSSTLEFLTLNFSLFLTAVFSYVIFDNYNKTNSKLTLLASIDPLTLSGNRRALDIKLEKILINQKRAYSNVSLLLVDVDHFKQINDNYGHASGDKVLVELVALIQKHSRSLDDLYRYGGEEFILLPLNVNLAEAKPVAEKLCTLIAESTFVDDIAVTVSIGVAQYRADETAEAWISRADAALYLAKDSGRNCVVVEKTVAEKAS